MFGYQLKITLVGAADELAAAASLVMGQASEGTPVVHVRGFPYALREASLEELLRDRPRISSVNGELEVVLKVVALAGGVGGARMAHGLAMALPAGSLTVVVNVGDDFEHFGLKFAPIWTRCVTPWLAWEV